MKISKAQNVLIRLATPQDAHAIVQLQYDSIRFLAASDYSPRQIEALLKSKSCPRSWDETIFIAEIDERMVGFASISNYVNTINAVFVKPDFVRRGIGTQLLMSLEKLAVKNNVKELKVCSSLTGYDFYIANGYKTIDSTKIAVESANIPCVNLKKKLSFTTKAEQFISLVYQIFIIISSLILLFSLFF